MSDFQKPQRSARSKYQRFLYVDGDQVSDSLSQLEGGVIEEIRSKSTEEANKGMGLSGKLGVSGAGVEAKGGKNRKLVYEEEVLRKRVGVTSPISSLLRQLHDLGTIGRLPSVYGPEIHEQIEEGELYEFTAEIRLHPFHQALEMTRGYAAANENNPESEEAPGFLRFASDIEQHLYGKGRPRLAYAVFSDIEGSPAEYKLAMAVKKEQLLVPLDEFSGKANFVAQVHNKIAPGRKYSVAHLLRRVPKVAPTEEKLLLDFVPILQRLPGVKDEGIVVSADEVVFRNPTIVLTPLCIYKG